MRIITGTTSFDFHMNSAVAIGKFDGLHLGHQRILSEILAQKENGMQAVIFTFDPSPEIFFGMSPSQELSTRDEKRKLFEAAGIDVLVEFPFNAVTAATLPEKFVIDILYRRLRARFVAAGSDLSYGARGKGDFRLLSRIAQELGFETKEVNKIVMDGHVISSTRIRSLVKKGRMEETARLLGRPYSITGRIVHGRKLGRRIGVPTLNQEPPTDKLLPPFGVYYSTVSVDGKQMRGMTNIGCKPTVSDESRITVETYLYDFTGDLYGEYADVSLLTYRRPERKFDSVETLRISMQEDIRAGRLYHGIE